MYHYSSIVLRNKMGANRCQRLLHQQRRMNEQKVKCHAVFEHMHHHARPNITGYLTKTAEHEAQDEDIEADIHLAVHDGKRQAGR